MNYEEFNEINLNFNELEQFLNKELEENIKDIVLLEKEKNTIHNPDRLCEVVKNVIWEQFNNQIGITAGQDFIDKNHDMTLDLRKSSHIQTSKNFEQGKLATHNYISKENLEKNYDRYTNVPHKKFRKEFVNPTMDKTLQRAGDLNKNGIKTVKDIYTGRVIPTAKLTENGEYNTLAAQREHVIPSAEIYKDSSLQMANTNEELASIINNPNNLQGYTTAQRNNRKSDKSADEMDNIDKNKHWEKAYERAENYREEQRKNGEERLKREGLKTRKEETLRIGKDVARGIILQLMSDFVREVIDNLVNWFKSGNKQMKTLFEALKQSVHSFVLNLKTKVINIGDTVVTTIAYSLFGPIVRTIKKIFLLLKQGVNSLKEAINYLKSDKVKTQPFDVTMFELGKIVVATVTAGGAIFLSDVIEKGLISAAPVMAVEIPFLGSLANILGIFIASVGCGIIGALIINLLDNLIAGSKELALQNRIASKKVASLKVAEAGVWAKLGKTYSAVGQITEETLKVRDEAVKKERNSLQTTKDALNNLDNLMKKLF